MEKFMRDFNNGVENLLQKAAKQAAETLHREYVRRALEIEAPDVLALGEDIY